MARIVNLASLEELREMTEGSETPAVQDNAPDRLEKVLSSLQAQCVKREYCVSDITKKAMKAVGGDREAASDIVDALVKDRFVDDARYASAFAREKSSLTGWGPAKIRYALTMKGISKSVIDQALPEIDEDAAEAKMKKVMSSKWAVLKDDPYGKFKLIKYGLTRGYDYDAVAKCADEIIKEQSCQQ